MRLLNLSRGNLPLLKKVVPTAVLVASTWLVGLSSAVADPGAVGAFLNGVFPSETPSSGNSWAVESAFPNIVVPNTTVIASNPQNNQLYVGSRAGNIVSFENHPSSTSTAIFMDITDRAAVVWDGGFLGMVFHPQFGQSGSDYKRTFYTFYTSHCKYNTNTQSVDLNNCNNNFPTTFSSENSAVFFETYLRLSRFEVVDETAAILTGDKSTEQVLLNIRLYNGTHRGGGLAFGNDGYLYLTIGDQWRFETAQEIRQTLEGGTMRFAVDVVQNGAGWTCPAGSHKPRRLMQNVSGNSDEMSGRQYCIPNDNPWMDPAGGVFEEYFSLGHRNPHRLAVDSVTGRLWSGEIGHNTREEINVIQKGRNYGWPFREGMIAGPRSTPGQIVGTLTNPVIDFNRSEANALIGGYVYRGTRYPELYGRYIAGDYVKNNIWAIDLDSATMTATKEFLTTFPPGSLATFGQDRNGEVYLGDVHSSVPLQHLVRRGNPGTQPPARLSQTGAFDLASLSPAQGVIPYSVNTTLWTDGAYKYRFMAIPNNGSHNTAGEKIGFSEQGPWDFPKGSVLIKHIVMPLDPDNPDPATDVPLETRFLVHGNDQYYPVTYKWRADGSEADLITERLEATISVGSGAEQRDIQYTYPGMTQCLECHPPVSGIVLGPVTRQLNGNQFYDHLGQSVNQLTMLDQIGMFSPSISSLNLNTVLTSKNLSDTSADISLRARSYLDSNCGGCHLGENGAAGRARWDARISTPIENAGMVNGPITADLGIQGARVIVPGNRNRSILWKRLESVDPGVMMAPIGKHIADQAALDLIGQWIDNMPLPPNNLPVLSNPGSQTHLQGESITLAIQGSDPDAGDSLTFSATGLPAGLSMSASSGVITGVLSVGQFGPRTVVLSLDDGRDTVTQSFVWHVDNTLTETYSNFSDASKWVLNGSASLVSNRIRLNNALNQAGTAFRSRAWPINASTSFSSRMQFRIHGNGDGADGLTFMLQGGAASALGVAGGELGYGGIGQSLAIEIDNYDNGSSDPDANHIGVLTNGSVNNHLAAYNAPFDLENGQSHTLWVDYDGILNSLKVYLAQGAGANKPTNPIISLSNIDIPNLVGNRAFAGFSGGTGGLMNNQDIENWTFTIGDGSAAVNQPPILTNPGNQLGVEGETISFVVNASDPDAGDTLNYTTTGLPNGLSINSSTGEVAGTLAPGSSGAHSVVVRVEDNAGAFAEESFVFTVQVAAVNSITIETAATQITAGQSANVSVAYSTSGVNHPILLQLLDSNFDLVAEQAVTKTGSGIADISVEIPANQTPGLGYSWSVTLWDPEWNGSIDHKTLFGVELISSNQSVTLTEIGNQVGLVATPMSFTVSATGQNGAIPSLVASGLPNGASFVDQGNGTGVFSWPNPIEGTYGNIRFTATSGGSSDSEDISITIASNINTVTVMSAPLNLVVGTAVTVQVGYSVSEANSPLLVQLLAGDGSLVAESAIDVNGSGSSGIEVFVPSNIDSASNYSWSVILFNPQWSSIDSENISGVTISQDSRPVVLAEIGNQVGLVGSSISFTVSASGLNGAIPSLTASGLPSGSAFQDNGNGSGTFSWANPIEGTYNNVRFTAVSDGGDDSENITIVISSNTDTLMVVSTPLDLTTGTTVNVQFGYSVSEANSPLLIQLLSGAGDLVTESYTELSGSGTSTLEVIIPANTVPSADYSWSIGLWDPDWNGVIDSKDVLNVNIHN